MKQCFDLLEKYILENATKYEVIDKNESEKKGEAAYYEINRKPKDTEEIGVATIEREITEIILEYVEDNWTEISIVATDSDSSYPSEWFTISKREGKISFSLN